MQYCPKCRISIRGDKTECPLCGGRVTGNAEPGGFPVLDRRRFSHMSLVKVGTFCLLTFIIIMNSLEILYDFKLAWVPFAVMGALMKSHERQSVQTVLPHFLQSWRQPGIIHFPYS